MNECYFLLTNFLTCWCKVDRAFVATTVVSGEALNGAAIGEVD